jgi:hypothetical protein
MTRGSRPHATHLSRIADSGVPEDFQDWAVKSPSTENARSRWTPARYSFTYFTEVRSTWRPSTAARQAHHPQCPDSSSTIELMLSSSSTTPDIFDLGKSKIRLQRPARPHIWSGDTVCTTLCCHLLARTFRIVLCHQGCIVVCSQICAKKANGGERGI